MTAIATPAQTFKTLHNFDGTDGQGPSAALVQGTDGTLYGTTSEGGAHNCGGIPCGTVFSITAGGELTTLHSFNFAGYPSDGAGPFAQLVQGTSGKFYGTTNMRGANNCIPYGCGTVFTITAGGKLTTLHSFAGYPTDGSTPYAGLVQGTNGNFYGTTFNGGANGRGTVFEITPRGKLTTLHTFDLTDGEWPYAALVQGIDGSFYGTTEFGGANDYGTVFKITPSGKLTTLYNFCPQGGCADGESPVGGLVQGTDGKFYGTTGSGGANGNCNGGCGTVFKITLSGKLTTLHSFDGTDGEGPNGLVQATDGNFYGTTYGGGATNAGTVFSITAGGVLATLHSFDGTDGNDLRAALVQGTNGTFYGTTNGGGTGNCGDSCGTVFSISVGLGPFVKTNLASGDVGAAVAILGTDLTGATSVTFNGTAATFTVKSKSEIITTVPTSATTGTVQVVTPGGTLSSNVPFRVTQ